MTATRLPEPPAGYTWAVEGDQYIALHRGGQRVCWAQREPESTRWLCVFADTDEPARGRLDAARKLLGRITPGGC